MHLRWDWNGVVRPDDKHIQVWGLVTGKHGHEYTGNIPIQSCPVSATTSLVDHARHTFPEANAIIDIKKDEKNPDKLTGMAVTITPDPCDKVS